MPSSGGNNWVGSLRNALQEHERARSSRESWSHGTEALHRSDLVVAQIAVEWNLLSPDQAREFLAEQYRVRESEGKIVPLADLLVDKGLLKPEDTAAIHQEIRQRDYRLPKLDRYLVHERLGEGGTSVVYRAHDRTLQRDVALKVLREAIWANDLARDLFLKEAALAAKVSSPNVVTIFDVGEMESRLYLVMELIKGSSLAEMLKEKGARSGANGDPGFRRRLSILEGTARGVQSAHDLGIVHRDLKPANILVTRNGIPKVADFGIAHLLGMGDRRNLPGLVMGTPYYMSPEQVSGKSDRISRQTDVYGLGAILYEILTGSPPHTGKNLEEVCGKIVSENPAPPRQKDPAVPREIEDLCLRALSKDPARRHRSASEFADEIRRHLARGATTRSLPRIWSDFARRRYSFGLVSLLIVALISAAALLAFQSLSRQAVETRDEGESSRRLQEGRRAVLEFDRSWEEVEDLRKRWKDRPLSSDGTPSSDPESLELQQQLKRREEEAEDRYFDALTACLAVRYSDSIDAQARSDLAALVRARHERAMRSSDPRRRRTAERLLRIFAGTGPAQPERKEP